MTSTSEVYTYESIKTEVSAAEKTTTIDLNVNQESVPPPRPPSTSQGTGTRISRPVPPLPSINPIVVNQESVPPVPAVPTPQYTRIIIPQPVPPLPSTESDPDDIPF